MFPSTAFLIRSGKNVLLSTLHQKNQPQQKIFNWIFLLKINYKANKKLP